MPLSYAKAEVLSLKTDYNFSEQGVQDYLTDDPSSLGLGDVEVVTIEKSLPKSGRLDMLLYDEQLNRRYEVELMLGATDPSHIIRCLEYWDIERRRFPAYEHVAVLVAEDVTSRFLNVMSLLAGSIPLIAIQMNALKVNDQVVLHFTRVLDQVQLRSDDEYELGERPAPRGTEMTRPWWEERVQPDVLSACDHLLQIIEEITGHSHRMLYRKKLIDFVPEHGGARRVWCLPRKTKLRVGVYLDRPDEWTKKFEDLGLTASLRRGNKAVLVSFSLEDFRERASELYEIIREGTAYDSQE